MSKNKCYVSYVPHGINTKLFYPIDKSDDRIQQFRKNLFGEHQPSFVLLYNNRNAHRKMTPDVILAFKLFTQQLNQQQRENTRLLLHTQPVDDNGTDLYAVIEDLCPEIRDLIVFTNARFAPQDMNLLYNSCDVVINIASNEGWGLSSTEAMLTGLPIINNTTGGLQDQMRFEDEQGRWIDFTEDFGSNHQGRYKKHGQWAIALFPASISLKGSPPTPYIFDDRVDIKDVANAIKKWYDTPVEMRKAAGEAGRLWATGPEANFTAQAMSDKFKRVVDFTLTNWTPPPRFTLYDVEEENKASVVKLTGICL